MEFNIDYDNKVDLVDEYLIPDFQFGFPLPDIDEPSPSVSISSICGQNYNEPHDLVSMSSDVDEVCKWLSEIGYPQFSSIFRKYNVDGNMLFQMTKENFMKDLQLPLGPTFTILKKLELLKEKILFCSFSNCSSLGFNASEGANGEQQLPMSTCNDDITMENNKPDKVTRKKKRNTDNPFSNEKKRKIKKKDTSTPAKYWTKDEIKKLVYLRDFRNFTWGNISKELNKSYSSVWNKYDFLKKQGKILPLLKQFKFANNYLFTVRKHWQSWQMEKHFRGEHKFTSQRVDFFRDFHNQENLFLVPPSKRIKLENRIQTQCLCKI